MIQKFKLFVYGRLLYPSKVFVYKIKWEILLYRSLVTKKCFFGPFKGEFGHLLGHNLPFITYLYSKGVKVEFCGMGIYRPFFVDEHANEIVNSYLELRDFFKENPPTCNTSKGQPADVKEICDQFIAKAKRSIYPFWDLSDKDIYFYYFRWWLLKKGLVKTFDLSKIYKTGVENTAVIFPRKWNTNFSEKFDDQMINNGNNWNYFEVAKTAARYFKKVYVIGHPDFTNVDFESFENVEVVITNNNRIILEKCSNAELIISQHSGTVYLGEYTDTQVLIIYKGGRKIGDIDITTKFKNSLGKKHDFQFAFSTEEMEAYLEKFTHHVPV